MYLKFLIPTLLLFASFYQRKLHNETYSTAWKPVTHPSVADRAEALLKYAEGKGYSTEFVFLVNLSEHSGKYRFNVYSYKERSVVLKGLVTHGHCNKLISGTVSVSNVPETNCSSVGKFRIGSSYIGRFGLAYKLHGLDKTNSNAYKRFIVLHAHDCVPDVEIAPSNLCESQGCPTVSHKFLRELKGIINGSKSPILLEMYLYP